jgi:hypothetical protein
VPGEHDLAALKSLEQAQATGLQLGSALLTFNPDRPDIPHIWTWLVDIDQGDPDES